MSHTRKPDSQPPEPEAGPTLPVEPPTTPPRRNGTSGLLVLTAVAILIAVVSLLRGPIEPGPLELSSRTMAVREDAPSAPPASDASLPAFRTAAPHSAIPDGAEAVRTIAGRLAVEMSATGDRLVLQGRGLALPGPRFALVSITRHETQDIVLISMSCGGTACAYNELAFVRLFPNRAPLVEMRPEFRVPVRRAGTLKNSVWRNGASTMVALGPDRGASLSARIGPESALELSRVPAKIARLSTRDCDTVRSMVRECARFQTRCSTAPFREFPENCPSATPLLKRTTTYLADHTTGFDLPDFAHVCARASQLNITPSDRFIRREICSGANPQQWSAEPPSTPP
jgi:hypothetical protein